MPSARSQANGPRQRPIDRRRKSVEQLLRIWAKAIQDANRIGVAPTDVPEGSLLIQLSHTMATRLCRHLLLLADEIVAHGSPTWEPSEEVCEAIEEMLS